MDCVWVGYCLGVVTHPAICYSRVSEGRYLEGNELEKKEEKTMLNLSRSPFIRDRVTAYIAPG